MEGNRAIYELEVAMLKIKSAKERLPVGDPRREKLKEKLREMKDVWNEEREYRTKQDTLTIDYGKHVRAFLTIESLEKELATVGAGSSRGRYLRDSIAQEYGELDGISSLVVLREKIEGIAFARNELNGVVDPEVLKKDKKELEKMERYDNFSKLQNALKDLQKNISDLEELIKSLETLPDPSEARSHALEKIKNKKDAIKRIGLMIGELATLLGITNITFDYENPDKIKSDEISNRMVEAKDSQKATLEEISKMDRSIQRDADVEIKKAAILLKYGIDNPKDYDKDHSTLDTKVQDIRKKFVPGRVMRTMAEERRATREISDASEGRPLADVASPRVSTGMPLRTPVGAPLGGAARPSSTAMLRSSAPGAPISRDMSDSSMGAPRSETPVPTRTGTYDVHAPESEYIPQVQHLSEEPIGFNLLEQVEAPGRQKIENGRIYRFQREDDKLVYLSEDIEQYTKNPKRQLKTELRHLRKRMISELGREEFGRLMKELSKRDSNLTQYLSANPFSRRNAVNNYVSYIGDAEGQVGQVQMLLALKSAVLPSQIEETIDRTADPYKYESDLVLVEEKGKLGIGKHTSVYEEPELMKMRRRFNTHERSLNEQQYTTDGILRPFPIEVEETRERTTEDRRRDRERGTSR